MPREFDVHFGAVDRPALDWRLAPDDSPDDDEVLAVTPPDVVGLLGFDPLEFEKGDPDQPRDDGGKWTAGGGGSGGGGKILSDDDLASLEPRWKEGFFDNAARKGPIDALARWMGPEYLNINAALRGGKERDWTEGPEQTTIRRLDKVFEKGGHDLPSDTTVFRGVDGDANLKLSIGAEFTDRGFVSTGNNEITASAFADGGHLMQITLPKGTRVIAPSVPVGQGYRDEGDPANAESGLLLQRGTRFRVTGKSGDKWLVEVVKK